ncbi:lysozyme family protein [Halobacillus sp. Marseille-Q1614]|uniref:lysozyme family protein n=1 Tax=Halobacillus sp. Marseille-Q1614 TaxID=2709134 RepID=UPI0015712E33|nr:lysozyme family protein [Halobacillus sp. Marseille-Q1614]
MPKKKAKTKFKQALAGSFLKYGLPIILFIALMHIITISNIGEGLSSFTNSTEGNISPQVLQYEEEVRKYAEEEGIGEYTNLILALMMQESGGRGNDPMQASESLCGSVGCIDDPELSIKHGVSYFANTLKKADEDIKLALQSYNFGAGFIDYVRNHGGEYTQELAIQFSAKMYEELAHTGEYSCIREEAVQYDACYGDIYYVDAVLGYYEDGDEELLNT